MSNEYYVSLVNLAEQPGVIELSQVSVMPGQKPIEPDLLDAVLRGEDTGAWEPEKVDMALKSVERIGEMVSDAQSLIDGFLRQRGYTLPLATIPRLLTTWARAITRYFLHKHRLSAEKDDPIVRDYKEALQLLQLVAQGKFSLGDEDPLPAGGGSPKVSGPGRTFDMNSLRDYGR